MNNHTSTYIPAMLLTSFLSIVLIFLAAYLDADTTNLVLTWIICLSAYILGIPVGMIVSPYKNEGDHFQKIGTLIVTFFSGFVVSKFTDLNIELLTLSTLDIGR